MVSWVRCGYAGLVNFVMLCVEVGAAGLATARRFGHQFQVPEGVVHGYIDLPREMPSFGQLGCGGFIVLGGHGQFVAARTVPAYLDKGPEAFRAVERLLLSLGVVANKVSVPGSLGNRGCEELCVDKVLLAGPISVGNREMDAEHSALTAALAALLRTRGIQEMQTMRELWATHSAHEESLFEKHDFGRHSSSRGALSGTASHCAHHRSILASMDAALAECGNGRLQDAMLRALAAEVQRHTEIYDAAYAGKFKD